MSLERPRSTGEDKGVVLRREDARFVTALARGLEILSAFDGASELGNLDLCERTGMAPATVSRLTHTLAVLGYLRRSRVTRKYSAGAGLLEPGVAVRRQVAVIEAARPLMEALARTADTTVILGVRDGPSMLFLNVVRPARAGLTVNKEIGSTVPIASTSAGLAYLVALPPQERAQLVADLRAKYDEARWMPLRQGIERATQMYRRHRFVVRIRSLTSEVSSVSVPLHEGLVHGQFVLTCAGPVQTFPMRRLVEELGPQLVAMVMRLRAWLPS